MRGGANSRIYSIHSFISKYTKTIQAYGVVSVVFNEFSCHFLYTERNKIKAVEMTVSEICQ